MVSAPLWAASHAMFNKGELYKFQVFL